MIGVIEQISNLRTLARIKARDNETKTVHSSKEEDSLLDGWTIVQKSKKSIRLNRQKKHDALFKDQVWSLMYRMGFASISTGDIAFSCNTNDHLSEPNVLVDIVCFDNEVAVAIQCKCSDNRLSETNIEDDINSYSKIRERIANSINTQYISTFKRQVVLVLFTSNIVISESERDRANQSNIILFDDKDLSYYENLVSHLGPAGKYQLLADMLPGKRIPGLAIRVPAIKTKIGGKDCYTFSVSPEYLLKISYVSHRSKGKASDVNTYQRMISKSRLSKIKQYITDDGIFPTNIVLNFSSNKGNVRFERISQEQQTNIDSESSCLLGWLDIRPTYKMAWIIDGQHRLYAYSGHEKAQVSQLSVIAFHGLLSSQQAQLFVDINAKQKSVKQSLLQELYAELHWDAIDPQVRVRAIISKAVLELEADPESALFQRIQVADISKDEKRCITLTSVYSALEKTGFHVLKSKNASQIEYGPLWAGENESTLKRTIYILKNWLNDIRSGAINWWDKGSGAGGGLAMNDGIITCLNVLRSVFTHLDHNGQSLAQKDNKELFECIKPYSQIIGEYYGSLSEEERKRFRDLRGIQGQTTRTKRCQQAIHEKIPQFNPPGLDDFITLEKAQTNSKAKKIIDWVERKIQKVILDELRQQFGSNESEWWILGVPRDVRKKVTDRFETDDGKRGGKEYYFEFIDYRKIISENWNLFESLFGYGKKGSKDKRTSWLAYINERRNIVSHPSSAVTLSMEELYKLEEFKVWLINQIDGTSNLGKSESEEIVI